VENIKRDGYEAWISRDKIIRQKPSTNPLIKNKTEAFAISDLPKLPLEISDGSRWFDNHVCFFGEISAFSNFHPARFRLHDLVFVNTEQYLFYQTAIKVEDFSTADKILEETDPREIKKLGKSIDTPYTDDWAEWLPQIFLPGLTEKYRQNPSLITKLLATGNRKFVECAGENEMTFGCGVKLQDTTSEFLADEANWPGMNMQGKLLDQVKETIQAYVDSEDYDAESGDV
jgi:hypothetical protein